MSTKKSDKKTVEVKKMKDEKTKMKSKSAAAAAKPVKGKVCFFVLCVIGIGIGTDDGVYVSDDVFGFAR